MRQIKLNFQQSQPSTWRWLGLFLLMASLALNSLLFLKNQTISVETNDLLAQIDQIKHPTKLATISEDDTEDDTIKNQLQQADAVMKQLNLPWPLLFKTLETTREPNIQLLEVSPNIQTREVLLVGQTENLKSIFDYIVRLKKSQVFSKVELNSHEKMIRHGAQGLRFTIEAKWLSDHE